MLFQNIISDFKYVISLSNKRKFLSIQIFMIITAFIELSSILSIIPFITLVLSPESIYDNKFLNLIYTQLNFNSTDQFLIYSGLTTLILFISSTILIIVTKYKIIKFNQNLLVNYGSHFFKKFLQKEYKFYLSESSNKIILNLHDDLTRLTQGFVQPLMTLMSKSILILFISSALLIYKPIITISLLLILSLVYTSIFLLLKTRTIQNGKKLSYLISRKYKLINESFISIKDIIISNKQIFFSDHYSKTIEKISKLYVFQSVVAQFPRYFVDIICFSFIIILIILFKIFYPYQLNSILTSIAFIAFSAYKLIPAFQEIYSSSIIMKNNRNVLSNIKNMFEQDNLKISKIGKFNKIQKKIQINNLSFFYNLKKNTNIFYKSDISIFINKSHVIFGKTGSGKTTLMEILLGLHDFSSDRISLDNKVISNTKYKSVRNQFSYVAQNSILIDSTILSNICFAQSSSEINKKNLDIALKVSHLNDFIKSLPDGLNTKIGEKGINISGGQKQRISLARAIYQNKPFLFLDESTSALDKKTEDKILNSILKLRKTIILITHRKDMLSLFNYKYLIKNGKIIKS